MKIKSAVIVALVAAIAIGGALGAFATSQTIETEANVEVTVWQRVSDGSLYLSTRPEGGTWITDNQALDMSNLSTSGRFRQGSAVKVAVPVTVEASPGSPTVFVKLWDDYSRYGTYWGLDGTITANIGAGEFDIDVYLSADGGQTWPGDCSNSDVAIVNVATDLFCDDIKVSQINAIKVVHEGVSYEAVDDRHYRCSSRGNGEWACTELD